MEPLLHPHTQSSLASLIHNPKGTYIFYGPAGTGRMTTARWLAGAWHGHKQVSPGCQRCIQIAAGTYPDLIIVEPEKDSVGIAQIQSLQTRLNLSRHDNMGQRIIVIDQADRLTHEAQNALLKSTEEPPVDTIIVLLITSPRALLPTLLSRSQIIRFFPLSDATIIQYLTNQKKTDPDQIQPAVESALGKIGLALRLLEDPEQLQRHQQIATLVQQFCNASLFERLKLAAEITESKTVQISPLVESIRHYLRQQLKLQLGQANQTQIVNQARKLKASLQASHYLEANVAPKTALTALALELGNA